MKTSSTPALFASLLIAMAPLAAATPNAPTTIVIEDVNKMNPEDVSTIIEALKTNATIQAYIDWGQWTVEVGGAIPDNALPTAIPLLLSLTVAQPTDTELNKAAEDYAFYYARTFQKGQPAGDTQTLIYQTVANLVGISPAILQRWPDFEQFLVANGIERQLKDLGDQISVGRYGIPTLNVNGKPYLWTIVNKQFPIDKKTGKLTDFTYTTQGIQPNSQLEADFEALVNAASAETERSAGNQSLLISKLLMWIVDITKQLNTAGGLPAQYVDYIEVELNGDQSNGVQSALQEIEKNQKNYPELKPQLDEAYSLIQNARVLLQHAKYLLVINGLKTLGEKSEAEQKQILVNMVQQLDQYQASLQQPITTGRVNEIRNDVMNFLKEFQSAERQIIYFEGGDDLVNQIQDGISNIAQKSGQLLAHPNYPR